MLFGMLDVHRWYHIPTTLGKFCHTYSSFTKAYHTSARKIQRTVNIINISGEICKKGTMRKETHHKKLRENYFHV